MRFFPSFSVPIQPVKIPQNVYIEDRIVGPLTLKQIIIVAIGGGFSYVLWSALAKAYGTLNIPVTVMVWLPGLVSAAFAFVKVNDLSMMRICLLFMERINKPPRRTWGPRRGLTINIRTFSTPAAPAKTPKNPQAHARLQELSNLLDNNQSPDEAEMVEESPAQKSPVKRANISAEPVEGQPLDGIEPRPSISIFRDIQPPTAS